MEKKFLGSTGLAKFLEHLYNVFAQVGHTHTKSQITDFPTIPTKVSQLDNDSGYITQDTNTTYSLTKDGNTITLTGTDGSVMSVEDSDTIIPVDSELSNDSLNPVQNKVIKSEFDAINALIGEASVEEQIDAAVTGIPQADWNQNDPFATDYIKNRTHYSETSWSTLLENDALEFTYDVVDYPMAWTSNLFVGLDEIVKITLDGKSYERQVTFDEYLSCLVAGNRKFAYGEDTGEPFMFVADGAFLVVETEGTHSVKIEKFGTTYHKLPEEYMPDSYFESIGSLQSDLMNVSDRRPNWDASEISDPEFIKNRPFYSEYSYEEFIGETTVTTQQTYKCYLSDLESYNEDTIGVMWDGTMYQCPYSGNPDYGGYEFGDNSLVKYPFYFYANWGNGSIKGHSGTHTYSIYKQIETVHKLNGKYFDGVVRYDAVQALNTTQAAQARENIGVPNFFFVTITSSVVSGLSSQYISIDKTYDEIYHAQVYDKSVIVKFQIVHGGATLYENECTVMWRNQKFTFSVPAYISAVGEPSLDELYIVELNGDNVISFRTSGIATSAGGVDSALATKVSFTEAQELTDEQKQQAQDNIGFSESDAIELVTELALISPAAAHDGSIYTDENGALYSL